MDRGGYIRYFDSSYYSLDGVVMIDEEDQQAMDSFDKWLDEELKNNANLSVAGVKKWLVHVFEFNKIKVSSQKILMYWEPRYQCSIINCLDIKNQKINNLYVEHFSLSETEELKKWMEEFNEKNGIPVE